jgi:hypothetical protein
VIGQAGVVGAVASIHQKAMPAWHAYHRSYVKIFAKSVLDYLNIYERPLRARSSHSGFGLSIVIGVAA